VRSATIRLCHVAENVAGDGKQPTCGRCNHGKKECIYETGRRFRRSSIQESFSDNQPWVSLPPRSKPLVGQSKSLPLICFTVQFIDESDDVRSQYTDDGSYLFNTPPAGCEHSPKPDSLLGNGSQSNIAAPPFTLIAPTEGLTVLSLLNSDPPSQPQSHSVTPRSQDDHAQRDAIQQTESSTFVYQQPPGQPILWPLEHEQEAMLLQHYIENVALFVSNTDSSILAHAHDL
jgi:hypothetical protein